MKGSSPLSIGLNLHRRFAEIAILEGTELRLLRIATEPDALREFAGSLGPDDQVVVKATANAWFLIAASRPSCAAPAASQPDAASAPAHEHFLSNGSSDFTPSHQQADRQRERDPAIIDELCEHKRSDQCRDDLDHDFTSFVRPRVSARPDSDLHPTQDIRGMKRTQSCD